MLLGVGAAGSRKEGAADDATAGAAAGAARSFDPDALEAPTDGSVIAVLAIGRIGVIPVGLGFTETRGTSPILDATALGAAEGNEAIGTEAAADEAVMVDRSAVPAVIAFDSDTVVTDLITAGPVGPGLLFGAPTNSPLLPS